MRPTRWARTMIIGVLLAAPAALAQDDTLRPPRVEDMGSGATWLYVLVSAAIVILCVAVAAFPSRRTHED